MIILNKIFFNKLEYFDFLRRAGLGEGFLF